MENTANTVKFNIDLQTMKENPRLAGIFSTVLGQKSRIIFFLL